MAFGTFMIPVFIRSLYQNGLLVQAQGQLLLTGSMVSQRPRFVNDFRWLMGTCKTDVFLSFRVTLTAGFIPLAFQFFGRMR